MVLAAGWGSGLLLTRVSIGIARRCGVVARPNHRTSHEGIIPRIGGIGIAVPVLLGFAAAWAVAGGGEAWTKATGAPAGFLWAVILGGAGAFGVGLWDDLRTLPAGGKLGLQVILAAVPPLLGVRLGEINLPGFAACPLPVWAGSAAAFVWVLFWMNAYNFMDGINGIAGRFGEIVALSLLVMTVGVFPLQAVLLAFAVGVLFGFLAWNLPEARTFMGDCGSLFLGYLFSVWTLQLGDGLPAKGSFLAMGVLTLPFSWDVLYTLIRRTVRGENLLQAHRSHLYQRLMSTGLNHLETLSVCEKTFYACGLSAVFLVMVFGSTGDVRGWICLGAAVLAMALYTLYVRGRERRARGRETVSEAADTE